MSSAGSVYFISAQHPFAQLRAARADGSNEKQLLCYEGKSTGRARLSSL